LECDGTLPRSQPLQASAKKGKHYPTGEFPTGGKEPRHFAIDPTGRFLLAENQNSNSIAVFRIDPTSGSLATTGETASVPSPVCLVFLADH
jgi:6-phosphogluconolactonase